MPTKNIKDVVAEFERRIDPVEMHVHKDTWWVDEGMDAQLDHDAIVDWLTTTLTQLVKEVEEGERNKIRHVALTMGDCPINNPEVEAGWMQFQHDFVRKITPSSEVTEK